MHIGELLEDILTSLGPPMVWGQQATHSFIGVFHSGPADLQWLEVMVYQDDND